MWTEAQVDTLRAMYAEGFSASLIGEKIGRTRNAVIGKLQRLRLQPRLTIHARDRIRAYAKRQEIIQLCRADTKLTLREVAAATDCTYGYVNKVLHEAGLPSRPRPTLPPQDGKRALGRLAHSLGLTSDDLRAIAAKRAA